MAIVTIHVAEEIDTQEMEVPYEESFTAGQFVPEGTYEDLETHRLVFLPNPGVLPASCDGHVAVYMQKPLTWGEAVEKRRKSQEKSTLAPALPNLRIEEDSTPALAALEKTARVSIKKNLLAA